MSSKIDSSNSKFIHVGDLRGHRGWVTSIATYPRDNGLLLTSSRDKTVMVWRLHEPDAAETNPTVGTAVRALRGHSHFVSDVIISSDGQYALSGSWDGTLRLWEISTGRTTRRFVGHTKDVLSVAFSVDNRQIISGSRDKTIKLWNCLGECKFTWGDNKNNDQRQVELAGHTEWVSCVRFSPNVKDPLIVSCGWDRKIKVWNLVNFKNKHTLSDHTGYLNVVSISPDGSLCASGGKDGKAILWDLGQNPKDGHKLCELQNNDIIHALVFSPIRYWLVVATTRAICVWDLEQKHIIDEITLKKEQHQQDAYCTSLAWSGDGMTLYAGYTDGVIRALAVNPATEG